MRCEVRRKSDDSDILKIVWSDVTTEVVLQENDPATNPPQFLVPVRQPFFIGRTGHPGLGIVSIKKA